MFILSDVNFSKTKIKYSQEFRSSLVKLLFYGEKIKVLETLFDLTIELDNVEVEEERDAGYLFMHLSGCEENIIKCLLYMRKTYSSHFFDAFNRPKQIHLNSKKELGIKDYIFAYKPIHWSYCYL
jgi:hypothetical protein